MLRNIKRKAPEIHERKASKIKKRLRKHVKEGLATQKERLRKSMIPGAL